ncbi:putative nucleotidyltransferase, ribonuclease H [Tanacetum coccineum]
MWPGGHYAGLQEEQWSSSSGMLTRATHQAVSLTYSGSGRPHLLKGALNIFPRLIFDLVTSVASVTRAWTFPRLLFAHVRFVISLFIDDILSSLSLKRTEELSISHWWHFWVNSFQQRYYYGSAKVEAMHPMAKTDVCDECTEFSWISRISNRRFVEGFSTIVLTPKQALCEKIAGIKVEEEIIRDLERLDIELCVRGQNGFWASLRVEPNLISQIKTAQKDDGEIWAIIQNIDQQTEFRVDDDGILWQGTKLCVPEDPTLREALMTEAHSSPFSIHPGSTKMYHDLKQHFWWSGMKRDVATFVSKCLICQQVKIEHQRASGLLQPLEIPVWKWDEISMDFVTGLPRTQRKHDAIWVVVDRLTKSAHFLPIRKDYPVSKLAEMFQQEIVRLHGTPSAIVSDRDPRFTSRFWKGLQKAWGTRLKFSTAFHPETDGQSERTIQTLEDMLRSCALEWAGNWDDYICLVEFAYNNSWHASIKCAPFEMLYGRKCRAPICWDQVGERILEGPEMIEVTNEKVAVAREKLKEAQTRQKSYADRHRRALEFQPGEHVFLKVSPTRGVRRFGIKGKLSPRFIGPFEILDRVGEVSYRLALPPQLSHVHNVFHVSLLRGYKYHPLHVVSYPFDQIREDLSYTEEPESILDRQDRVMRNKTIPFVKILWRNHPEREATWETEESIRTSYPHFLP